MNDNELRDAIVQAIWSVQRNGIAVNGIADAVLDVVRPQLEAAEAENERHRRANLVRAVVNGYDEWISEAINAEDFDRVPWLIAEGVKRELDAALERERVLLGIIDRLMSDWVVSWQSGGPMWEVPGYRGPEPMSEAESAFFASRQETT